MDAWCVNLGGLEVQPEAMSRFKAADTGELVGELDGDTVTFDVEPGALYECVFVNTLVPEDSVGGETRPRQTRSRRPTRSVGPRRRVMRAGS